MTRIANVVGGGIGGVATAACLAKAGFEVRLFERSTELREIGAGIFLKENSLRAIEQLGQLAHIERTGAQLKGAELWARGGRTMLTRSIDRHRVFVLPRQELHAALVAAALENGVQVHVDAEVVKVDVTGAIELADGRSFHSDLTVGADGVHSIVRDQLGLGRGVRLTGAGSWRVLVEREASDPSDTVIEYWSGRRRILVVPSGPDLTYLCASSRDDDVLTAGEDFDKEVWSEEFPQFSGLIGRISTEGMVRRQHVKTLIGQWHKGRVAVLGDAVHGQPPNLGQGAGLAIANGASLARNIEAGNSIEAALVAWEAQERKFTEAVQSWSNGYDDLVHSWPLKLEPVRSALVRFIGSFPPTRRRWAALGQGLPDMLAA